MSGVRGWMYEERKRQRKCALEILNTFISVFHFMIQPQSTQKKNKKKKNFCFVVEGNAGGKIKNQQEKTIQIHE